MGAPPSHDHFHPGGSTPAARVLARVQCAKRVGDEWLARCPAHDDRVPSLSIREGDDGRALVHCFAGCDPERVVSAIGLTMADLFPRNGDGGGVTSHRHGATAQHAPGCTLAAYAAAKRLPADFLRRLGLADISYLSAPALRIPYFDETGQTRATQYRIALGGEEGSDRFRWKSGDKPCLYGRWRRDCIAAKGYAVLVEGASDCHTLWFHDEPAIGLPGAGGWQEMRDAALFDGVETIFVVIEPDRGGETVAGWLAHSRIRDRVRLVDCGPHKDPSGMYLATGDRFRDAWRAALGGARRWADVARETAEQETRDAWAHCRDLAQASDVLSLAADAVEHNGLVGEGRAVKLVYLALVSRLFDRPVSIAVKGPSSGGKSYLVARVLELFPARSFYALSAMSERALAYSAEPLAHRFLVIYEAAGLAGDFASYLMRSLLSEGRVRYETVEKTRDGMKPRLIEREGPTGLIVTTTAVHLHAENETRLLSLPVTDSAEQTRNVFRAIAEVINRDAQSHSALDLAAWHALQTWLEGGERRVAVPFAPQLAEMVPTVAVRLRRDFTQILALIRAHALLHRATRRTDRDGRIVATIDDYDAARELVADLVAEGVEATVPDTVRETVETAKRLLGLVHPDGDDEPTISLSQLTRALKLDKSTVSRRVRVAVEHEYLRNLETRRGKPMRLAAGDPMPAETDVLPTAEALRGRCTVAGVANGMEPPPSPTGACCVCHAPLPPGDKYLCAACAHRAAA